LETTAVTPPVSLRPYTHLINLVAQRSKLLLAGTAAGSQEYMRWVHSLERDFGVSIEVRTIMGPTTGPRRSAGRSAGQAMPPDCQLAFTVDGDETRCAVRYC
jgi:hypothetical protein